ncbi:polyphenol oxidase family protein [Paratractidigestivibacter sp.]|uniref:polyphenol oxidase family protein n=1 Tax=Paratractidigestivibacter sp. TaxID=2847316 RepID=UPI002ABE441A|nr:polyphenol oxidase family protein [Paratractidigestivibacter sp.]
MASLSRYRAEGGVTLLADTCAAGGVTFAFTERAGGVSKAPFTGLNLGDRCGDDPAAVAENRRRALAAIGASGCAQRLVSPHQVHGDNVVIVREATGAGYAQAVFEACSGADAVVCTASDVPVLMCFADCVPVVICAPGGFSVVHSGWRGSIARICQKAAGVLASETGCAPSDLMAYVGPCIGGVDYEVSSQLISDFVREFGAGVCVGVPERRKLSLSYAVACALTDAGVTRGNLAFVGVSTAASTDRFYSYRAEKGTCGRHAALAVMSTSPAPVWEPLDNV